VCVDATPRIGCSTPCGNDDRHLGKGHGRPRHNCAVCPLPGSALLCNVTRGGHEDAWQTPSLHQLHQETLGSMGISAALHQGLQHVCWRRPLVKANVFALELKSRPRRGAICRQEPSGCDGSWPLSAFRTVGTTLGCFHTKRLRPVRPTNPRHRAGSGQTDGTPKRHRR
jgi:hypothetical protein